MKSPFTGEEMAIIKEWRTLHFRKEAFQVLVHLYQCKETGEQFEDETFAILNYNQLINNYRAKFAIPFPEQIISTREKYDVPASKMSEILGFGANVYRQYEKGEVPSQSNARLIQLIEDPHEFKKLVELCATLDKKAKEKILKRIDIILFEEEQTQEKHQFETLIFDHSLPNKFTGFKIPNLEKFKEMVIFFSEKQQPWKTKLNKLLFYSDFLMFNKSGFSISGAQYRAITMGPVPNNFNTIFDYLERNNDIIIEYQLFPNEGIGEKFLPSQKRSFHSKFFSSEEIEILHQVHNRFKDFSTKQMIDISHTEKASIENNDQKKIIDYTYGFDLN